MKRVLLLLIAVFLMAGCNGGSANDGNSASSESRDEADNCVYNDFYWGMDRNDIIKEKGEPITYYPDNSIQYSEQFMEDECYARYCFDEKDNLNQIVVTSQNIDIYEDIKDKFIESFGSPISDGLGDLGYTTNWKVSNTDILLEMSDSFGMYFITYSFISDGL